MLEKVLKFSIQNRWLVLLLALGAGGARRPVVPAAADRRRPGHHQQPGPDQHARPGPLARAGREAGDVPGRDGARRHPRSAVHPLALAQRVLAGHGRLRRRRGHLLRPQPDQRAARRGEGGAAGRGRAEDGADLDGPRRSLHVDRRVRAPARRGGAGRGRGAGLAERRRVPDARGPAAGDGRRAGLVPAHRAGLDHPPAAQEHRGRGRDRRDRRLREAVPRPARPDEARQLRADVPRRDRGLGAEQRQPRGRLRRAQGRVVPVRIGGLLETVGADRRRRGRRAERHADPRPRRGRRSASARSFAPGRPARTATRSSSARP